MCCGDVGAGSMVAKSMTGWYKKAEWSDWMVMVLVLRSVGGVVVAFALVNGVWERVVASCPGSPRLTDENGARVEMAGA